MFKPCKIFGDFVTVTTRQLWQLVVISDIRAWDIMPYICKVGSTSVRQVPVTVTCSFRLTTQIWRDLWVSHGYTCVDPQVPRLMLSLSTVYCTSQAKWHCGSDSGHDFQGRPHDSVTQHMWSKWLSLQLWMHNHWSICGAGLFHLHIHSVAFSTLTFLWAWL